MIGLLLIISKILVCLIIYNPLLTKGIPFVGDAIYVGCYTNFDIKYSSFETINVEECLILCSRRAYILAAITIEDNSTNCHCGNLDTHASTIPTKYCLTTCAIDDEICGQFQYYAVYTAVPTYLGCFRDNEVRDLSNYTSGLIKPSNPHCITICKQMGLKYAATQAVKYCSCGNEYGRYGQIPDIECNEICDNYGTESCGGTWANSVYSIQLIPALNLEYGDIFHCMQGSHEFASCKSRRCMPGWKGRSCNLRDCRIENGKCGNNVCQEYQSKNVFKTECLCRKGFGAFSIYHPCEELRVINNRLSG